MKARRLIVAMAVVSALLVWAQGMGSMPDAMHGKGMMTDEHGTAMTKRAAPAGSGETRPATPPAPPVASAGMQRAVLTAPAQSSPAASGKATARNRVPKDIIILKGAPMGGVKLLHSAHAKDRNITCQTCHHPPRTKKPAQAAQQACSDCHSRTPAPPMKTRLQAAFHNPSATAGTCIDCHKAKNATGKKAPAKCQECHKKENA